MDPIDSRTCPIARALSEVDGGSPNLYPLQSISTPPHSTLQRTPTGHHEARVLEQRRTPEGHSNESGNDTLEPDKPQEPSQASILSQMFQHSYRLQEDAQPSVRNTEEDNMRDFAVDVSPGIISQPSETTPLLRVSTIRPQRPHHILGETTGHARWQAGGVSEYGKHLSRVHQSIRDRLSPWTSPKSWNKDRFRGLLVAPLSCFPAVLLGLLLNVLDALSYGMILFPLSQPVFSDLAPDGLSIFYVSCIVSQLVFSFGGSKFKGGVGSEMIEVVPFFHKMAFTIMHRVGEDRPQAVIATTILSYAISSILTGIVFWIMGRCRLGALIGFFPRHILIGCIGGVGFFLIVTVSVIGQDFTESPS